MQAPMGNFFFMLNLSWRNLGIMKMKTFWQVTLNLLSLLAKPHV
jgi:hypothetical protein